MFVDIHSHIIPDLDDGARDKDIAIEMLETAFERGTSHIIATPHYIPGYTRYNCKDIINRFRNFQVLVSRNNIYLTIHPGCEVFISPDLPELFTKGEICTLNMSSYMLIELPMVSIPPYTDSLLYELQLKGIKPIIAHPERNEQIIGDLKLVIDMVRRGILIQINSGSITGLYGKTVRKAAMHLIKRGIAHFVASDSHSNSRRSPDLSEAAAIIEKAFGTKKAEELFIKNGMAVLKDESIDIMEPAHVKRKENYKKFKP